MIKRMTTDKCVAGLLAVCLLCLLAMPASGDSLQREGFPAIEGVTLIGVKEGKLVYRTAGGDQTAELKDVVDLSIDSVPEFKTGMDAFKAGELRSAQKALENVWGKSRVDWIRHFAGFYLLQVYDKRGEPVDAAAVYAKLAAEGADLHFLSKQPVESLDEADENQRKRMGEQIMAVVRESKGEHRTQLRAFHRVIIGEDAPLPEIDDPVGKQETKKNELIENSKVILPQLVWRTLERPEEPEGKWSAIELLSKGQAKEALEAIKPWLSNPGDLPEKLFIRGKAQLMLAEQSKDKDMYADAGLTFMRIVVHFERAGSAHPLVAPAKLEVAHIHKQIERQDIYDRILFGGDEGGGVYLMFTDQSGKADYPQYHKRYYQIIGEEVPADEPAQP